MTRTQIITTGLALLAIMVAVLWWSAARDRALNEWATKYEACVKAEYRTTPWEWYAEHGEYPECDVTKPAQVEEPETETEPEAEPDPIIEINL